MKNKVEIKNLSFKILLLFLSILIVFLLINMWEYKEYKNNFNAKINGIIERISIDYPNIKEEEIIEILNSESKEKCEITSKYGLSLDNKSIILENDYTYQKFLIIKTLLLILSLFLLILIFLKYLQKESKIIREITKYLEELNKKNYELKIDSNREDELSLLSSEIYKTTVMLKETKDLLLKDKKNLKKSLEDISHQLKTPLTSILILLDNLLDEPKMKREVREDFIRDIKRNILNINFLVQSLLTLTKFDTNTIKFKKEVINLNELILTSIKNVEAISDLKNIKINVVGNKKITLKGDFNWQVEALTNILKNCLEHSFLNTKIDINYEENKAYTMISIRDYGEGISKDIMPHIFERFYMGNERRDNLGIGLSLAKTIIEEGGGEVKAYSLDKGTKFVIKYYHI